MRSAPTSVDPASGDQSQTLHWSKRPLGPIGRGLLLIGVGGGSWGIELVAPGHYFIGDTSIPYVVVAWFMIAMGAVIILRHLVGKALQPAPAATTTPQHDDVVKAPRPAGAPTRFACRKCGDLVDASTLENGQCASCWVVRDGAYR